MSTSALHVRRPRQRRLHQLLRRLRKTEPAEWVRPKALQPANERPAGERATPAVGRHDCSNDGRHAGCVRERDLESFAVLALHPCAFLRRTERAGPQRQVDVRGEPLRSRRARRRAPRAAGATCPALRPSPPTRRSRERRRLRPLQADGGDRRRSWRAPRARGRPGSARPPSHPRATEADERIARATQRRRTSAGRRPTGAGPRARPRGRPRRGASARPSRSPVGRGGPAGRTRRRR